MFGNKKKGGATGGGYKDHSFIAPNTEITGDVRFAGGLHVEGKIHGNIQSDEGSLHVHGEINGEVRVPHIVINGVVKGDVHCSEHLELAEKAHVIGNVYYKSMEMQLGAQINGGLTRTDSPSVVQLIEHKPSVAEAVGNKKAAKTEEPAAAKA